MSFSSAIIQKRAKEAETDSSGDGRAACRECNSEYPETARREGIEGKVGVSVDTDARGHVTNVRLLHSSGNRDLDEETLKKARDWKLKTSAAGRQGVAIDTDYVLEGSKRYHQMQERQKQKNEENKKREAEDSSRHKRHIDISKIIDVPPERKTKHDQTSESNKVNSDKQNHQK